MLNTTNFEFGQIVLVRFPFTDQRGSKQRPAVVVSSTAYHQARPDIILMAVTSQIRVKTGFGEVVIQDWRTAGLLKPSAIKAVIFTAERTIIGKTLGRLVEKDRIVVRKVLQSIIG